MLEKNIIINKKSAYGDSFRKTAEKSEENENENIESMVENQNEDQTESENNRKELHKPAEDINLCAHTPSINQISDTPLMKENVNLLKSKDITRKEDHQIRTLEPQLAALKSHLKCEITNVNSKIETISNVLDTKLRESNDQNQNIVQMRENIKFFQTELKEKNEFIKTLMETQAAALDSLTIANQQHHKQNLNKTPPKHPECNNTNKSMNRNTNFEKENSQNQQQSQQKSDLDVWNKVTYHSNNQEKNRISKRNLDGDAFVPNIQLKNSFHSLSLNEVGHTDFRIETEDFPNLDYPGNTNVIKPKIYRRGQVVINQYPEKQLTFSQRKTPNKKQNEASRKPQIRNKEKIIVFGDSIPKGIKLDEFNQNLRNSVAKFQFFPGATSRKLLHYVDPTLEEENFKSAVIHVGTNDLMNNYDSKTGDALIENIKNIALKCIPYGVCKIFISSICFNNRTNNEYRMATKFPNYAEKTISNLSTTIILRRNTYIEMIFTYFIQVRLS